MGAMKTPRTVTVSRELLRWLGPGPSERLVHGSGQEYTQRPARPIRALGRRYTRR